MARQAASRLAPHHSTANDRTSSAIANTSAARGAMRPVTSGRPCVRVISASMSRSMTMLIALAPPAASVPPNSVIDDQPGGRPALLGEHHGGHGGHEQQLDHPQLHRARRSPPAEWWDAGANRVRRRPARAGRVRVGGRRRPFETSYGCCDEPANRSAHTGRHRREGRRMQVRGLGGRLDVMSPAPSPVELDEPTTDDAIDPDRPWVVIVWNDPINLMSYVTFVLAEGVRLLAREGDRADAGRAPQGSGRGQQRVSREGRARRVPAARARPVGHDAAGRLMARLAVPPPDRAHRPGVPDQPRS